MRGRTEGDPNGKSDGPEAAMREANPSRSDLR